MEGFTLLKDITHDGKNINNHEWSVIESDVDFRIYFRPISTVNKEGFDFYAVQFVGGDLGDWSPNETYVECVFSGVAYFDGVRHLYWGDEQTDNQGYFYYPNLNRISEYLRLLEELEEKYCTK